MLKTLEIIFIFIIILPIGNNTLEKDDHMPDRTIKNDEQGAVTQTVDKAFIEKSVQFINDKANETLYQGAIEIGSYLLKHFFDDNIVLATSKNPRKPKSFKVLCKNKNLAVPYTTLTIMVRVAAQELFFNENNVDTGKLSYTHKSDLVRLENTSEKLEIARLCIENNLSTRELSHLVSNKRQKRLEKRKSQKDDTPFTNIATIEQLLNKTIKSELVTDLSKLRGMHQKTREDLKDKTARLIESMLKTTKECKRLIKNLERVEKEKTSF